MRIMLLRFFPKENRRTRGAFLDSPEEKSLSFPYFFRGEFSVKETVARSLREGAELRLKMAEAMAADITAAATAIAEAFKAGRKLLLFGNGGSAADAQHIAAEFMNRFLIERPPLPAIALTTDTSVLTSIANDYAFDDIFSKQVKALGKKGDVALGITTSGTSANVLKALRAAKKLGMITIALTGDGGKAGSLADIALQVPSRSTPRIQEAHIAVGHILCDLTDTLLFKDVGKR
jgi:D-sedoheptulose 7-phosphate isomerase